MQAFIGKNLAINVYNMLNIRKVILTKVIIKVTKCGKTKSAAGARRE